MALQQMLRYADLMGATKKITVRVPADLLEKARRFTGRGTTETVRNGLEASAAADVYRQLRALRGKVDVSIDLEAFREDRG